MTKWRVIRIDRGWSTLRNVESVDESRVRNIGAEVAVGDIVTIDGERVTSVLPRKSAITRRRSGDGVRVQKDVIAANVDVVLVVQAADQQVNPRRIERELTVALDSMATPRLVLNKADLVDPVVLAERMTEVERVSAGVSVHAVSATSGEGLTALLADLPTGCAIALIGASGVGKSSLANALSGSEQQVTGEVREGDQRGRHTTTAAELIELPQGRWLVDTPGLRVVSLWLSGHGIERAFPEIFSLADSCKFRDCKHESEPGCAVVAAVESGTLDVKRVASMKELVAEEAELEGLME
ncbi:MAG: ribosome small subunit-dependent GTPase A [Ilumatobacteraceae bacterium]